MTLKFIAGSGEMRDHIRSHDWSNSSLGPLEFWPQSLKTALSICLGSKFPMFVWWGKDLIVFYNDAYIPLAGPAKHPHFLGRPAREQWAEIWSELSPLTDHVFETGTATWAENMPLFMTRNGYLEETYFTFSYSPVRDETGAVGGIINPCQETTERVLADRRLKALRELGTIEPKNSEEVATNAARVLKDNPQDCPFVLLYLTDPDGSQARLVSSSGLQPECELAPSTFTIDGDREEIFPISHIYKVRKPKLIEGLRAKYSASLPTAPYPEMPNAAYLMPIELTGQEMPYGFLVFGVSPRLSFDEKYQGFFNLMGQHIATHFSNVHAYEIEKKRAEGLLELDRAKTAFFNNVSHEFRTPLTLILGHLEELLQSGSDELTEDQRERTRVIHRNALRLHKLVNTLLDFSRIETTRQDATFEAIDISKATHDLASTFRSSVEAAGIRFQIDCHSVKEAAYVNPEMWEKIVLNLISNAFKYTARGEISVSLRSIDQSIELIVNDTGVGISKDEIPKIFQRFHRVPGVHARNNEGTGIGLSLVKELVSLHKGTIEVESTPGKGSSFIVRIPKGASHLPAHRIAINSDNIPRSEITPQAHMILTDIESWTANQASPLKAPSNISLSKRRIVLAEDNSDMRDYLKRLLGESYDVVAVADGRSALDAIRLNKPDLLLSDVMMPVMDGVELVKTIRSDKDLKTLQIILLSARSGEEDRMYGIELGADDYLVKPFSSKELFTRIENQIRMAELRRSAEDDKRKLIELEQSNIELERYARITSHDLQEPLRTISMSTQLMIDSLKQPLSSETSDFANQIVRGVERMRGLIDDLLAYSRVASSKGASLQPVNTEEALKDALESLQHNIQERNAQITYGTLPIILGQFSQMSRLFSNLISNAIKFCSAETPAVHIEASSYSGSWIFSVRDNGIGFDEKFSDQVFEMFRRLHPGDEFPGTGMGLAICKKIVEVHGGKIWAKSKKNRGSIFYFSIPATATTTTENIRKTK